MDDWSADVDADLLSSGRYAPVLILVPPVKVGPPIRRILEGEFPTAEHARMAALDAVVAMALDREGDVGTGE
jgi:hypothetical protein